MELVDAELIAEFAVESQEGLANIEQQMLAIEAGGANVDVDLVNAVFRTMHSIKGNRRLPRTGPHRHPGARFGRSAQSHAQSRGCAEL